MEDPQNNEIPECNNSERDCLKLSQQEFRKTYFSRLIDSINEHALLIRNISLMFLLIGLYMGVLILSISHKDLFLKQPITLPLFNLKVPLEEMFEGLPIV